MSNFYSNETNPVPSLRHFLPLDITASQPSARSSLEGGISKLRQYHEAKASARAVAREREQDQAQVEKIIAEMKENVDCNAAAKLYSNSEHAQPRAVKGMHMVRKMKEIKAQDRRVVLSEIEKV